LTAFTTGLASGTSIRSNTVKTVFPSNMIDDLMDVDECDFATSYEEMEQVVDEVMFLLGPESEPINGSEVSFQAGVDVEMMEE